MNLRIYILFFIASIIILFQFILEPNIIFNNDLNGNIVPLLHFKESILQHHQFPQWNPYINQGIPAIADPLYGIYNPMISIPILLLPYQLAIKSMYLIALFLACITMFLLAKQFKISSSVSSIIALTYASGTYFVSRITAGHLEKVISFALIPLFLYCLIALTITKNVLWSGLTAIVLSLILFSGDIYNTLFLLYSLAAIFLYYLFKDKKVSAYIALTTILFVLFSSIKILPMIQLQDYISKIKEPFAGELNILSLIHNLFFPLDSVLSAFSPIQNISTGFPWWESLSFIGPLAILGLIYIVNSIFTKHNRETSILIILTILFFLLTIPASPFNPIRYITSIIEPLQFFHVPSRILLLWGIIILISLGIFIDKWKRRNLAITLLLINLIVVFVFSQNILSTRKFEKIDNTYNAALNYVANNNPDNYYTVHETSQGIIPQDIAYLNHLLLLQSNYGLFLKDSLGAINNYKGDKIYDDIKAGFLFSNNSTDSAGFNKLKEFNDNIILYEDQRALPFAQINNTPQKVSFSVNKITVMAESKDKKRLVLLESNYPGWKAFVDGNKKEILEGRFLEIETIDGNHKYEFVYSSIYFYFGLIISSISFIIWLFFIIYNSNIIRKKRFKKS